MSAIAAVELRRFLRDRSNIFFVFLFPLLLILVLGSQFGGDAGAGRVGVAGEDGVLRSALVRQLEADGMAVAVEDPDEVRGQLARGRLDVGLVVPTAATTAFEAGRDVDLAMVVGAQQGTQAAAQRVRTAVTSVLVDRAQVVALTAAGVPASQAQTALAAAAGSRSAPRVQVVDVDDVAQEFSSLGQFDLGAAGETLLFVFLVSLAGSTTLIQARRLGVVGRTLSAPVSTFQALAGQALGRFAIAFFQGAYIMLATVLLFGVSWGRLWVALLVLAVFSAVAAGAAMVVGSLLDNDEAASGAGVGLGLVLAALGGCMLPLDFFPDTLRTVAYVTPHAWAYDAFALLQRHNAGLVEVLPQLGVLSAMAAALLALGTWTLRRSMTRAL